MTWLSQAAEIGISPERFWRLTLRELQIAIKGSIARREYERECAILSGWIAGYCNRHKRFPKFEDLIARKQKKQTLREQLEMAKLITSFYSERK